MGTSACPKGQAAKASSERVLNLLIIFTIYAFHLKKREKNKK
jgi:hypothetical protein